MAQKAQLPLMQSEQFANVLADAMASEQSRKEASNTETLPTEPQEQPAQSAAAEQPARVSPSDTRPATRRQSRTTRERAYASIPTRNKVQKATYTFSLPIEINNILNDVVYRTGYTRSEVIEMAVRTWWNTLEEG